MQKLLRRIKNKKGFTLMEMLIVVAIIVILVAVSVPVFTNQLGEAREATDAANLRAAKSLALTMYMTGEETFGTKMYYDIESGEFVDASAKPDAYSKAPAGKVVYAVYDTTDSELDVDWE